MDKFQRLVVVSALHDGYRLDDHTEECHPATRARILAETTSWAKQSTLPPILWFSGPAGAGKTAIVRSTCVILQDELSNPFAAFFFWKADSGRNTLKHFPVTIAHQLYQNIRGLRPFIEQSITDDPMLLDRSFQKQMQRLVIDPLLALHLAGSITAQRIIILIDGLDECDADGQRELLRFLPHFCSQLAPLLIGCFIASRPESSIYAEFQHPKLAAISMPKKLEASEDDIKLFLIAEFDDINARYPFLRKKYGRWPSAEEFDILVKKSSGFFICPKTAIRYINSSGKGLRPDDRLCIVLSAFAVDSWHEPIDKLYLAILNQHAPMHDLERFKQRIGLLCLPALHGSSDTFPYDEINVEKQAFIVFQESLADLRDSLVDFQSLFSLDDGAEGEPIKLNHATFRDFIFSYPRSREFHVEEQVMHAEVISRHLNHVFAINFFVSTPKATLFYSDTTAGIITEHLRHVVPSTAATIGHLIDEFDFAAIPQELNLLFQVHLLESFIDPLYDMAAKFDFPQGQARAAALKAKVTSFFNERKAKANPRELALVTLACSPRLKFPECYFCHDTECIQRHLHSSQHLAQLENDIAEAGCACARVGIVGKYGPYGRTNSNILEQIDFILPSHKDRNISQVALDALVYILTYPEKMLAIWGLAEYDWIVCLLRHCPPNEEMHTLIEKYRDWDISNIDPADQKWAESVVVPDITGYLSRCCAAGIGSLPALGKETLPDFTQSPLDAVTAITSGGLEQGNESQLDTLAYERNPGTRSGEDIDQVVRNPGRDGIIANTSTGTGVNQEGADGQPSGVSQKEPVAKRSRRWKEKYLRFVERVNDGL